jgi:signal transduction histidine kinase
VLLELTHDLRQPLSTIEAIAYYLEMTIPAELLEARSLLARVQQLLESADGILERAEQSPRQDQLPV